MWLHWEIEDSQEGSEKYSIYYDIIFKWIQFLISLMKIFKQSSEEYVDMKKLFGYTTWDWSSAALW